MFSHATCHLLALRSINEGWMGGGLLSLLHNINN